MFKPIKHISTFQIRSIHLAGYLKQRDCLYFEAYAIEMYFCCIPRISLT